MDHSSKTSHTEIILPSRYCKDCQLKEISTTRNAKPQNVAQDTQKLRQCVLFGRSVGRVKDAISDKKINIDENKGRSSQPNQNKSNITLVRLMFYLPNISKETDVWFFLDEVYNALYLKIDKFVE